MNKKGEIGIGAIMVVFVAVLVGLILFTAIEQEVGKSTTLVDFDNTSITVVNNTAYYMTDYRYFDPAKLVASNWTSGWGPMDTYNFTLVSNTVDPVTGGLAVSITPINQEVTTETWLISVTDAQTVTYVPSSGARSIAGLIGIFFALAILIVSLSPTVRESMNFR